MRTTIRLVAGSLSLMTGFAAGAAAGPLDVPGATKALACSACHGPGGQSPSSTIPSIRSFCSGVPSTTMGCGAKSLI